MAGPTAEDDVRLESGVDPAWLSDETRPIPTECWHRAMQAVTRRFGAATLEGPAGLTAQLQALECLGYWRPALTGSTSISAGLQEWEQSVPADSAMERWVTCTAGRRSWTARLESHHDPALEKTESLRRARELELLAGLATMGAKGAKVATTVTDGNVYVRARWRLMPAYVPPLGAALGALIFAVMAHGWWLRMQPWLTLLAALVGTLAGCGLAWWAGTKAARQRAHRAHVLCLERTLQLRHEGRKSEPSPAPGGVVDGRYVLGERLGHGAFCSVYAALRLSDREPTALKVLHPSARHDAIAHDRLRREAAALSLSWHPNVVGLLDDHIEPDSISYLALEQLAGESLAERLERCGRLTSSELLPIARQLCAALTAVHAAGVVHRDVKPRNIFLCGPPEAPVVKLLDFGIAHVEWEETHLTQRGKVVGTPGYAAPEQTESEPCDKRSDIFAVGVVLRECLTGVSPCPGAAPPGQRTTQEPISPRWSSLIGKATEQRPQGRFQSASNLDRALIQVHLPEVAAVSSQPALA